MRGASTLLTSVTELECGQTAARERGTQEPKSWSVPLRQDGLLHPGSLHHIHAQGRRARASLRAAEKAAYTGCSFRCSSCREVSGLTKRAFTSCSSRDVKHGADSSLGCTQG